MTRIQLRRGSAANWTSANPTLEAGEVGFESDTGKVKVGTGSTAWTSLPYFATWGTISGKPGVIAAGATAADARTAIDAEYTGNKGQSNGYASLDSNGKVPGSQLPNSIMTYEGLHDVSANSPTLSDATGEAGAVYRVSVGGTRNYGSGSIELSVGDYLIHSGSAWQKADTTDAVSTVAGRAGNVVLTAADVRDANGNIAANNHIEGLTSITTANGTTTLTAASPKILHFTGGSNQTLVLPSTGITAGHQFIAINNSTGTISGRSSNNSVIHVLGPSVECIFTALVDTPTEPSHWEDSFYGANFAEGKVLSVNSTLTLAGTDGTSFTFPPANDTVVGIAATQTLTNKTLTSPTLNSPTLTTPVLGTPSSGNLASCVGQVADVSLVGFSKDTTRATGTGDNPFGVKLQRAVTFTSVTYRAATADASGNLVVELRKNGVAVSGSAATIAAANQVAGGTATGSWSFAEGDILTVQITGIGTTPGKGLVADIKGLTA